MHLLALSGPFYQPKEMTDFITASYTVIQLVKSLYPFIEFDLKPEGGKPSRTKAIIGSSLSLSPWADCPSFAPRLSTDLYHDVCVSP